ncbi:MAG: hypothetical protein K0U45_06840 [Alphaproteobacteria bacterium]|nr:hypothetical protein [Alphaproteobacteria bacterium]
MVKYIHVILVVILVILLASCGMENFPSIKNVPHVPEEKLQQNDDNRPSIVIEES